MSATWFLNDNDEIVNSSLPQTVYENTLSAPYPASVWYLSDDDIIISGILPNREYTENISQPYPATIWFMDDNDSIVLSVLRPFIPLGAFVNCSVFSEIKIPSSVKSLGEYTFANTNLMEVTIASDCTYYPTTFPSGCIINTYEEV